ncbi:MAG: hypothetical protein ACOVQ7_25260 [Limnoraphis robusta]|jgi:hypothetical protein
MAWTITAAAPAQPIPNYGTPAVKSVTSTSGSLIPAGTGNHRIASLSVDVSSSLVYVSIGSAVNVATGNYNFILNGGYNDSMFELSNQEYFAATQAGTAEVIVAIAE